MVAFLTIKKIYNDFTKDHIPAKIEFNKTYTTIGSMEHNDIKIPFAHSKNGYISIIKDEEGEYHLSPYDLNVSINDDLVTETVSLRDKDLIHILDNYTFIFTHLVSRKTARIKSEKIKANMPKARRRTALQRSFFERKKKVENVEHIEKKQPEEPVPSKKDTNGDKDNSSAIIDNWKQTLQGLIEQTKATQGMDDQEDSNGLINPFNETLKLLVNEAETIQFGVANTDKPELQDQEDEINTVDQVTQPYDVDENELISNWKETLQGLVDKAENTLFLAGQEEKQTSQVPETKEQEEQKSYSFEKEEEAGFVTNWKETLDSLVTNAEKTQNIDNKENKPSEKNSSLPMTNKDKETDRFLQEKEEIQESEEEQKREEKLLTPNEEETFPESQKAEQNQHKLEESLSKQDSNKKLTRAQQETQSFDESNNTSIKAQKDLVLAWKNTLQNLLNKDVTNNTSSTDNSQENIDNPDTSDNFENIVDKQDIKSKLTPQEDIDNPDTIDNFDNIISKQEIKSKLTKLTPPENIDNLDTIDNFDNIISKQEIKSKLTKLTPPENIDNLDTIDNFDNIISRKGIKPKPEMNVEDSVLQEVVLPEQLAKEELDNSSSQDIIDQWKKNLNTIFQKNRDVEEKKDIPEPGIHTQVPRKLSPKRPLNEHQDTGHAKELDKKILENFPKLQPKVPFPDVAKRSLGEEFEEPNEMEMTLMWDDRSAGTDQEAPQLISPFSGEILSLEKQKILIGRSNKCDMCLLDNYISRQHLELKKIPVGFLLKNIGKNEVIIEKKGLEGVSDDKGVPVEEKILKAGKTTLLVHEATIIIGNQILYYCNKPTSGEIKLDTLSKNRKYNFYKALAEYKKELLEAAQLQKRLTPPRLFFKEMEICIWFKFFAINDLSGDFFLYHKSEEDIYFCLGDVSGHGAAAALLASQISGMFRILAQKKENVPEIANSINENLFKAKRRKHNLYALANILKVTKDTIEICIAGNSVPPLYYCSATQELNSVSAPSTPIGLFNNDQFKTFKKTIHFQKNDLLIIFTDGVTEAEMPDGGLLEYHRAQTQIEKQIKEKQSLEVFLDNFLTWLKQSSEICDDLSIVLIAKTDKFS